MSADTPQDSELKQLLADTAALRRRYRAVSQEEPPAQLDEAIRAAARRDVRARPRAAGSRLGTSWHIPASIAAVVVVSVTLAVMVAQHDTQLPVAKDQPTPTPARGAEAARDQAEAAPASGALKAKAQPEAVKRAVQAPPQAAGPPASSEASTATAVEKLERSMVPVAKQGPEAKQVPEAKKPIAPTGIELRVEPSPARAPAETAPPTPAAAPNAIPAPPALQEGTPKATAEGTASALPLAKRRTLASPAEADSSGSPWEKDPQGWLGHIEELRAAGRSEDAAISFRAFRTRYPDYQLPAGFVAPGP